MDSFFTAARRFLKNLKSVLKLLKDDVIPAATGLIVALIGAYKLIQWALHH